jgi:hypothetical protein
MADSAEKNSRIKEPVGYFQEIAPISVKIDETFCFLPRESVV